VTIDLAHQADFAVGGLRIRPATLQVEWTGASETLEPRIMQVLVVLGQRAGEVVSRDDLIRECWEGRAVGDDALNRCISRLRKLGEASAAFGLETIPRVGYRLKPSGATAQAADKTGATEPPAPAGKASSRKPLVIVVAILAVLAIGAIAMLVMLPRSSASALASQRTAFFGFSADGDDAAAASIAKSATREAFDILAALGFETAPETQTQNIERSAQLARAKELGARYALGGEVLHDGDQFKIAIRLEDVELRTTLGQDTLTGGGAEKISLSARAATSAANALQCYIGARIGLRTLLRTETSEILRAMVRVCAVGGGFPAQAEARRQLARLAPDSPGVQTNLALWLFLALPYVPAENLPVMRREIDAALKATVAADPDNGFARAINTDLGIADGKSLKEAETLFNEARERDPNLFYPNLRYGIFLRSVGRYQDAVPHLRAAMRLNPLTAAQTTLAHTLAVTGLPGEAKTLYADVDARGPGSINWQAWITSALFDGEAGDIGDPREIVKHVPPDVSADTAECMKVLVEGALSKDLTQRAGTAQAVLACERNQRIQPLFAIVPVANLGKVDDAFALARRGIDRKTYTFDNAVALFATGARPMRADPRFLELVKDLGIYQYWLDTGTRPDFCNHPEEEGFLVCATLPAGKPEK
jgi:DNA-binding winged helix-turn-helix (wHTH) protein/tetratricopeptide (TPR) repeat protein